MNARLVGSVAAFGAAIALAAGSTRPARAQDSAAAPMTQVGGESPQAEFKRKLGQVVQRQLGLTDEQLRKLEAVNQKYEAQRFMLTQQERELRITIRDEVLRGDSADQGRVKRLLDEMFKVLEQRLNLVESEQKDLSAFLTPVQRAKYLGIQEQVRQRLQALRNRAAQGQLTPQQERRMQRMQQRAEPPAAPAPAPPPSAPPLR